jgi:small-conductance mechanosensitive channel
MDLELRFQEYFSGLATWEQVKLTLFVLILMAIGAVVGIFANGVIFSILQRSSKYAGGELGGRLANKLKSPSRLLLAIIGAGLAFSAYKPELPESIFTIVGHLLRIGWIIPAVWLVIRIFFVIEDLLLKKYDITSSDNLRARSMHTQVQVFNRVFVVAVVILTLGGILMSIDEFRRLGASLLASAGVAGIVIGLAAQKTLGNALAGIQIAFTQPIRLDDVVIVEGEWGWVEEITFTYVVVRGWDKRRVILPVSYFLEKPFQNWTKTSADLLGTVYLYTDWTVPVQEVRAEAKRLIEAHELWDGVVANVQVTGTSERTVELRALMSSGTSPELWQLRCDIREGLIDWLQKNHPECLPRVRAELEKNEQSQEPGDKKKASDEQGLDAGGSEPDNSSETRG